MYPATTCQNGHTLGWTPAITPQYANGFYTCNCCGDVLPCGQNRWFCPSCSFDLCPACLPSPVRYQYKVCTHGHPLVWVGANYPVPTYICDLCHGTFPCASFRWCCPTCQFDVCPTCMGTLKCRQGHTLSWNNSVGKMYFGGLYGCDKCRLSRSCPEGRWHCGKCNYDLCVFCAVSSPFILSQLQLQLPLPPQLQPQIPVPQPPPQPATIASHDSIPPKGKTEKTSDGKPGEEKFLCKVCYVNEVSTMLRPCGHTICSACAGGVALCPFDRKPISEKVKMFFS